MSYYSLRAFITHEYSSVKARIKKVIKRKNIFIPYTTRRWRQFFNRYLFTATCREFSAIPIDLSADHARLHKIIIRTTRTLNYYYCYYHGNMRTKIRLENYNTTTRDIMVSVSLTSLELYDSVEVVTIMITDSSHEWQCNCLLNLFD